MDALAEALPDAPQDPTPDIASVEYVGFWKRVAASLIDTLIVVIFTLPLLWAFYGPAYFSSEKAVQGVADLIISWVLPAAVVILFWRLKGATPGKMAISARIVDATTGGPLSNAQAIGRYFAYFVSVIPLCLGLVWVGFDRRKQGWHDKLANTVVIYDDD